MGSAPRIVVIGSNGQLGSDLMAVGSQQGRELVGLNIEDIDVADMRSVQSALNTAAPAIVINTAAAHGAEQSTAAEQQAFYAVNALGPWYLARWCWVNNATLVHYSTDYVFGTERFRERAYIETDAPCPVNIYGASKMAGELMVGAFCPRYYVLRIASVYGQAGCRAKNNSNFVKMTLGKIRNRQNMKVVHDQYMSPTWTKVVALKTFEILDFPAPYGLYHLAGSGTCTWYEFACEIVRLVGGSIQVEPIATPADTPSDITLRPRFTALDNSRLRQSGFSDLAPWAESLSCYLKENLER